MTIDIKAIKARRQAITMGEGDWHRMKYEDDGSSMPDFLSAGQSKEGYSLDVIISECAKSDNIEFICHCPVDIDNLVAEIERLQKVVEASKQCCALSPDECDMGSEHCKDCESWDYSRAVKRLLET